MREVCVFLTQHLCDRNPDFIKGLEKSLITVRTIADDDDDDAAADDDDDDDDDDVYPNPTDQKSNNKYQVALEEHYDRLLQVNTDHSHKGPQPRLCLVFEQSLDGVRQALAANMTVIGIGVSDDDAENNYEDDGLVCSISKLQRVGAHVVATSITNLLQQFHIERYYQVQYLPYTIQLRRLAAMKIGYPTSFLDDLSGRFVRTRRTVGNSQDQIAVHDDDDDVVGGNDNGKGINDEEESEEREDSVVHLATDGTIGRATGRFLLDQFNGQRVVPRRVLGIEPDSLADVYINNIGWPQDSAHIWKLEARELELDIVRMFGRYYNCRDGQLRGYVTSGGSEGNFTGLWWSRDYLRATYQDDGPILLTSNQTHYSVHKSAHQLVIEERLIDTDAYGSISVSHLSEVLDQIADEEPHRPVIMNVNLGTTQTGALDPLPDIHRLLVDKVKNRQQRFVIHADAALMGACLPFIQPFGPCNVNLFDAYDVTTLAVSGHKFFGSVCICGLCLTTAEFLKKCDAQVTRNLGCGDDGPCDKRQNHNSSPRRTRCGGHGRVVSYIGGLEDRTLGGSRSGFNTLSFHNTLCALGMHTNSQRLKILVDECYRNISYFLQEMELTVGPQNIIHPPHSLTICFRPRPTSDIMEEYQLMPVDLPINASSLPSDAADDEKKIDDSMRLDHERQYAGVCILVNVDHLKIDRFFKRYRADLSKQTGQCLLGH